VNRLIEAPTGGAQAKLMSRSSSDPADLLNRLGGSSGMPVNIGSRRLLPGLTTGVSTPRRAPQGLPFGILIYLFCLGIIAIATIGVFFGIGFFLLARPTEVMSTNSDTRANGSDIERRLPRISSETSPTYGDVVSVPIEPQIPRSAATAALPAAPLAPPSRRGDEPTNEVKDQSLGKRAAGSEAREASTEALQPAAPAVEPPPDASAAGPPAPAATPRLSGDQIAELLARGDSFLHAGDVASARLFYERAADAGNWQGAIRMGATFDPAFLGRSGVRTVGDTVEAESWYRHALDLGAPKTDRQVVSPKTN
jgi:hypothetical protein